MRAMNMIKEGIKQKDIARILGVSQTAVTNWKKRAAQGGLKALRKRKRGVPTGTKRRMSEEQEKQIQRLITDKTPDQLKMAFALWNRDAVRQLIEQRFGITYTLQALSMILHRWGFTPQRPVKAAYEQRPAEVRQWLDETYPQVRQKANKENAEIWWGDETAIKPECHHRRGYAPKGRTPLVRQPAKRFHSSLISAVNNQGSLQWMALRESLNAEIFIKFLRQLIKGRKRKVILIVDNLRVHHSKPVKAWVNEHRERIELVYLPSYSPDLNPDEYLNNHLKQTVTARGAPRSESELKANVSVSLRILKGDRKTVRNFFKHPKVAYAA